MFESMDRRLELERQIRRYLGIGLRRWRWLVLGFGLATLVGGYRYLKAPRIFQTTSQVMLSQSMPQIMGRRIETVADPSAGRWRNRKYEKTQHRLMEGAELADAVSKALQIHPTQLLVELENLKSNTAAPSPNPLQAASKDLVARLERLGLAQSLSLESLIETLTKKPKGYPVLGGYSVLPQRDTDLIDIQVRHRDPEWAQLLATTVAEVFVRFNLEQRRAATGQAAKWLGQQVDVQRLKLEEAELALQEFKETNNIISVSLRDRTNMTMDSLKSLANELSQTTSKRVALEARLSVLDTFEGDFSTLPEFREGRLGSIQSRLLSLREAWIDISATYTDAHPKYQTLARKIDLTEAELRRVAEEELDGIRGSLNILVGTERRLQREVDRLTELSLKLNRGQLDFERLQRDRQNAEQMYSLVLQRHKEAELEEMMNINNASVVKKASLPSSPVTPVRRNFILFTLVCGLGAALGLAMIREILDSTVKSHETLEDLGEAFLGIFPALDGSTSGARDLFVSENNNSSAAECARTLRTNLLFMNPEAPPKTLGVSSASPQEGKSTVAIALATTMAQSGSRTILIDADMRRPRLHKAFELEQRETGLSSLIVGEGNLEEALRQDILPGLDLLCCGPVPPNPSELLHTPGFEKLLDELKAKYDRVIFDAPPINPVSDPTVLATMVDGMVVVVASHQTRTPSLSMAMKRLSEVNAKVLGFVLNKVALTPGTGYGYGQYSYSYQYYTSSYSDDDKPSEAA